MSKKDKTNIKKGLSFFKTITLFLIVASIILVLGFMCYHKNTGKTQQSQAIVITENIIAEENAELDSQDLIGDFILHHEYFTADAEVLQQENENFAFEPEIEKDIQTIIESLEKENITSAPSAEKLDNDKPEIKQQKTIEQIPEVVDAEMLPLIAVVVDDMGINQKRTLDIISIQAPLTSSFLTYGRNLNTLVNQAQNSGHEIMIHTPMEPKVDASLAPDTLKTDMSKEEIESSFLQMLKKFADIDVKGINNHMGSKFTEDKERLSYIMDILKTKNMFFLDSKTTSFSKGKEIALEKEIDFASRDIFLDNENNYDYIFSQLIKAEKIARKKGYAIAICHPKSQTYFALKDWVETLKNKDIKLVHVSQIIDTLVH